MHDPENTTRLTSIHLLLLVVFLGTIPLAVLWLSRVDTSDTFCSDHILPFWSGEYPAPVVVVDGDISVNGFTNTCFSEKKSCIILQGIYHPWSDIDSEYLSLREPVVYQVKKTVSSDLKDYPANTKLYWEGYATQDKCAYRMGADRWIADCPIPETMLLIEGDPQGVTRQFFSATCTDNTKIWLEVLPELIDVAGIRKGVFTKYGSVAAQ